jgi:hypothetical protein
MLQVVEINAIEHLESIRLRWTSLLYDTTGASSVHTLDWLHDYCERFGASQRLRVFLVHRGGNLLGILPLVQRTEFTDSGPLETLTYPTPDINERPGPIGPNPTATLMAVMRHLASHTREWDCLALTSFGDHDCGRTSNAMELAGLKAREHIYSTTSQNGCDGEMQYESSVARYEYFARMPIHNRLMRFKNWITFKPADADVASLSTAKG